jgi:hypothetical protein
MSLTSYRAAPPRGSGLGYGRGGVALASGPGGPGGDLLSRGLGRSTIGAGGFHGRVRDGIGCAPPAMATRPSGAGRALACAFGSSGRAPCAGRAVRPPRARRDQACRAISTGPLNASLRLHARPIDVMVCHGSRARPGFEVGFPLRCLQRLSRPHIATRLRGWRHDRSTRGASIPVLSY